MAESTNWMGDHPPAAINIRVPIIRRISPNGTEIPPLFENVLERQIVMSLTGWNFPESTATGEVMAEKYGTAFMDPFDWGVVVWGYRCSRCRKVFFTAEQEGLIHECMTERGAGEER